MKRLSPSISLLGLYDDDSKAYIVTVITDYKGLQRVFVTWFGLNRASEKWKIQFFLQRRGYARTWLHLDPGVQPANRIAQIIIFMVKQKRQ